MIKILCNGNELEVNIEGPKLEVMAELVDTINQIYNEFDDADKFVFEQAMKKIFTGGF